MASSSRATTLMLMTAARYSSDQSDSTASTTRAFGSSAWSARRMAALTGSQRISTPLGREDGGNLGRKSSATEAEHQQAFGGVAGAVLLVLALSTMRSAMSNSAVSST